MQSGRYQYPQCLAKLIADIAKISYPRTGIDPSCEDLTVLNKCDFLTKKRAIFCNEESLNVFKNSETEARLELGDICQQSLNEAFDLVTTSILPTMSMPSSMRMVQDGAHQRRRGEVVAERCLDIIAPNGLCLLLIPESWLAFRAFSTFRDRVLKDFSLDAVIESRTANRRDVFPSALLVIRNGPRKSCGTFMGIYKGTQLVEGLNKTNTDFWESVDRPRETNRFNYIQSKDPDSPQIISAIKNGTGHFFVNHDQLTNRWDYNFHDPAYKEFQQSLEDSETRELVEIADIWRGSASAFNNSSESGDLLVVKPRHVNSGNLSWHYKDEYVDKQVLYSYDQKLIRPGDILVSLAKPTFYIYKKEDPPAIAHQSVAVIRSSIGPYITTYFKSEEGAECLMTQMKQRAKGSSLKRIGFSDLVRLKVPMLPLDDLNSISDEAINKVCTIEELECKKTELLRAYHRIETVEAERHDQSIEIQDLKREKKLLEHVLLNFDSRLEELKKEYKEGKKEIKEGQAELREGQSELSQKIDKVLQSLHCMQSRIDSIKQGSRREEEKITLMYQYLEEFRAECTSHNKGLEEYVSIVQDWLHGWENLDELTKQFLPSAEHLYDTLEGLNSADFSPFVLQYCRSLENEILSKLFVAYQDVFIKRIDDRENFLKVDLENKKTQRFAKNLKEDKRKHTLGEMKWVMDLMAAGGKTLQMSPLLQDFRSFSMQYFDERIIEKAFLAQVESINSEYRVKSAHPSLMSKSEADECVKLVRRSLCEFLESYRREVVPLMGGK